MNCNGPDRPTILRIAARGNGFMVDVYRCRDANLRRRCRRLVRDGLLKFEGRYGRDFHYSITDAGREAAASPR